MSTPLSWRKKPDTTRQRWQAEMGTPIEFGLSTRSAVTGIKIAESLGALPT